MAFGKAKRDTQDALWSDIVRARDGWRCQFCLKDMDGLPTSKYHNSHFHGRAHKATRFHPDNCDGFCAGCHSILEDEKGAEYRDWKLYRLGEEKFNELESIKNKYLNYGQTSKEELRAILKKCKVSMDFTELVAYINANAVEAPKAWHKPFAE